MVKVRLLVGFIVISIVLFILAGCNEQNKDVPKTGIPILISVDSLDLGNWKGKLSESGKEVIIEVTSEQTNKMQADGCQLVIYSSKQDKFFENPVVKKISDARETEKGKICDVLITLNSDEAIDKSSEIEALLFKKKVIAISKAFIQEDEKGKYVWKVENIFEISDNGGQTSTKRASEKLINPKKVYIELGETGPNKVEVKKGLSEGDVIAKPAE